MTLLRVLLILIGAAIGIAIGFIVALDSGSIQIQYGDWKLTTTLWAAGVALLLLLVLVGVVTRFLNVVLKGNRSINAWWQRGRTNHAITQTKRALEQDANGNTVEAIRLLEYAGSESDEPVLHYLLAAHLAERIGESSKASELRHRVAVSTVSEIPVLKRYEDAAQLLENNQHQQAKLAFERLLEEFPQCAPALVDLIDILMQECAWEKAIEYLNVLGDLNYISHDAIEDRRSTCWEQRLRSQGEQDLTKLWRGIPKTQRESPQLRFAYIEALKSQDRPEEAFKQFRSALKGEFSNEIVQSLVDLNYDMVQKRDLLEQGIKEKGENGVLLLALGQIQAKNGNFNAARRSFMRSKAAGIALESDYELTKLDLEGSR